MILFMSKKHKNYKQNKMNNLARFKSNPKRKNQTLLAIDAKSQE